MSQSSTYNIKINIEKKNTSLKYIISIEYDKGATLDGEPEKDRDLRAGFWENHQVEEVTIMDFSHFLIWSP